MNNFLRRNLITITINTDNAAFEDDRNAEVARILDEIKEMDMTVAKDTFIRDINGNSVGKVVVE